MTGFDTKAIHGGIKGKNPSNALNPPIFQTSTFVFDNIEHANKIMSFESDDYVYTRGNNPTLRLFENRMAELEYGAGAVAFSSGMAAISSTIFSLLKPEDTIIVHKTLYGSSYSVITELLPKYNMNYKIIDLTNLDELKNAIDSSTKVIYFETPSNPDLSIIDITKVSEIAKKNNIKVVVDNTFASPYFQNPLLLGADIVVHSATKYICGHGDVVGGVAIGKDIDYIQYLKFGYMCEFGGVMSPFNAWLLLRGLKTLGIRMRQHEKNAIEVVNFLKSHPKIDLVLYPGLEEFKGHSIAEEQMKGFGAMISFEVKGGLESAIKFVDSLKLAQLAVSLGDCETLVQLPAAITHRGYPRERLAEFGLTESMVRISVGLEDSKDIIEDLEQALKLI
ncbi:methionine-gamma-lyase [Tissierella praeacuta DSM 18095]|uniref:homocysteine desulfhydrase n=1 Tax=Tissierella praeacuta DSM 18095 TaxID=1123404 RepID=A0A1M4SSA1_9FIRM|nr:PLP-dependent aspartate aminotransferase family protein [Tissierella praeacuta]SHE35058.1 methionine-gamma-lyase [Tissierella praeacuta DSM 18095]SUP01707.1 Methionine gamma-lyase [Tissierella praeacuta]